MERSLHSARFHARASSSKPEVARVQLSAEFPLSDYYGFIIRYTKKQVRFCLPLVLCLIEPVLGGGAFLGPVFLGSAAFGTGKHDPWSPERDFLR